MYILFLAAGLITAFGIFRFFPSTRKFKKMKNVESLFGFGKIQNQANDLGLNFKFKHYLSLLLVAIILGAVFAWLTKNILFVVVGGVTGFFLPKIIFSRIRYKKRRELLLNLPGNLRLLASKFRDCKSLQKSLEMSLPVMSGETKSAFERLHRSLQLGVDVNTALQNIRGEIQFKKFDDLCGKIIMGNRDGFHARVVESIRESIDDLSADIQLLQNLEIENRQKIVAMYGTIIFCWGLVFMFAFMEGQIVHEFGSTLTLKQISGKILACTMFSISLLTVVFKDKFLRLNLDNL